MQFQLSDDALAALKEELIESEQVAIDEDGKVLVWIGTTAGVRSAVQSTQAYPSALFPVRLVPPEAERRQLTVMFCDLVGSTRSPPNSTPKSTGKSCAPTKHASAAVIDRFDGHIAQYLGDGLLVYFGYPTAHEDDACAPYGPGLGLSKPCMP